MKRIVLLIFFFLASCNTSNIKEKYKEEILLAEKAFAQMAMEQGVEKAFLAFAADSAVLSRGDKILQGENDFKEYFSKPVWQKAVLQWRPDFIDVSACGDLGYTYGSYTFVFEDSTGTASSSNGIFHTVWKRQPDGSWKFVWD